MNSQKWQSFLHFSFLGEHVLFENLRLESFWGFFVGAILTSALCLTERLLTFAVSNHWCPSPSIKSSKWRNALWRSGLYWIATLIRLLYMLIAMSYHIGLIIVTATALTAGQFIIELRDTPQQSPRDYMEVPLLNADDEAAAHALGPRSRHRSNPDGILIHPNHSDVSHVGAVGMELGFSGNTESAKAHSYTGDQARWDDQKGKSAARGSDARHSQL